MKTIYKFEVDYGRHGSLSGIFSCEKEEIESLIGKEIHFGDVLGKHSEVILILQKEHLTEVTNDEKFVELFDEYNLQKGFNPLDYHSQEEVYGILDNANNEIVFSGSQSEVNNEYNKNYSFGLYDIVILY